MHSSSETLSPSSYRKQGAKLAIGLPVLLVICLFGRTSEAQTSTYIFDPNQSTVVQTGGFAGVHETYPIEGQFQLSVDFDAGIASFDKVDANLTEPTGFLYTQSLGVLFNMTELSGTIMGGTAVKFKGKTSDGTDTKILLTLTFTDDSVHLRGETIPPPGSADFFEYNLDAVAQKKYGGGNDIIVSAETSTYAFLPELSAVVQTGGFAGVHETYAVAGQFQLTIDSDTGLALFEKVDANLTDEAGSEYGRSLDEIFNMTGLAGIVVDETTIEFEGKTADGTESDVRLKLSLSDGSARLTGNTTPPPNTADMFLYDVNAVATKKYAGGTGEPNDPYQIATAKDLIALGETPEDFDKHFILTVDIDLDPNLPGRKIFDKAVIAPDTNDTKDYFEGVSFTGAFDGKSHVISNLHIQGGDYLSYLGLFGQLDSGAMVSNLGLEAVNVNGTGDYVGGLAGKNDGSIATSYSTGTVSGSYGGWYFGDEVGGLVGLNYGSISMSYSTGMVTGRWNVGGLAGSNSGNITKSHTMGTVIGDFQIGGLVGANGVGTVIECYSTGTVNGDSGVGGLVGLDWGEITMSYSTGTITGNVAVGGLVGLNVGIITTSFSTSMVIGSVETGGLVGQNGVNIPTRERNGSVINCYSMGAVTGDWAVGGLVGANRLGNIDMSYSTGLVTDTDPNSSSPPLPPDDPFDPIYKGAGGLVGGNISNITSCFWDIETSSQATSDGGTGKTTAEMQTVSTFLDAGWDFVGETDNGTEDIWSICEGTNYPRFVWQIPAGDFVCPDGITVDDFLFFADHWRNDNCDSSNDYCEGTDLDKSGTVDINDLEIFFDIWLAGL